MPASRQAASASSPGSPKWKLTTGGRISSSASSRWASNAIDGVDGSGGSPSPSSAYSGAIAALAAVASAAATSAGGWQKKLSWNGRSVEARTAATWACSSSPSSIADPRPPSAPAALTAAASSGVAMLAMGAWRTGCSTPSSSVTCVRTGSSLARPRSALCAGVPLRIRSRPGLSPRHRPRTRRRHAARRGARHRARAVAGRSSARAVQADALRVPGALDAEDHRVPRTRPASGR